MILIVQPNWKHAEWALLPLGLGYITACLKTKGFEVQAIDALAERLSGQEIVSRIKKSPELIFISVYSEFFFEAKALVETLRQKFPKARIIAGGPHASALPRITLELIRGLDGVVQGEGETPCLELAKNKDFEQVPGLWYRNQGGIIANPAPERLQPDCLPWPAWEEFPIKKYWIQASRRYNSPFMNLITSRGCPYKCSFCSKSVFGGSVLFRDAGRVIGEIAELKRKYEIKHLIFSDDMFGGIHAEQICKALINKRIKLTWECMSRVDCVNPRLLGLMKRAGCRLVCYGVESSSDQVLKQMDKGFTAKQALKALKWTKRAGIDCWTFFMLGYFNETKQTIKSHELFLKQADPLRIAWFIPIVFPGTRLAAQAKSYRLIDCEGNPACKLDWRKSPFYHFEASFSLKELQQIQRRLSRRFYLNPAKVLELLKKSKSMAELRETLGLLHKLF
jgi:anaerobic magnesium-protoporphyrin IX monomethyl ester cyclase